MKVIILYIYYNLFLLLLSIRLRFLSELNVLSRLNHVNITRIFAIELESFYFIQEHSDLGTLQDYFRTRINDLTFQK